MRQILAELKEIFDHAISETNKSGIPVKFFWSDNYESNAWVCYNTCEMRYEIRITKKLMQDIYRVIFVNCEFNSTINEIMRIYDINKDEESVIKKTMVTIIIGVCFFHELGHIINGHLVLFKQAPCLSENEASRSVKIDSYNPRSLLEADADSYSALETALMIANGMNIQCEDGKKVTAAKQITLLSVVILFYFLGYMAKGIESPDYPPYFWRLLSIQVVFIETYSSRINGGDVPKSDLHICINDSYISNNFDRETKSIINSAFAEIKSKGISIDDIFSSENIVPWYEYYRKNIQILLGCHEFIKNKRRVL